MKALVLRDDNSVTLNTQAPFPSPTHGSVTVRVIATIANPNFVHMIRGAAGSHQFTQPRPLVPGANCVARIVATGPDAVSLKVGQLVLVDGFVRARDDPDIQILWGMHDGQTPESKKLHRDVWRDGSYAEYLRTPLENTYVLDEETLCGPVSKGGLGYAPEDLLHLIPHGVSYGGFRSINLQPGETVVVSPATGVFSGATVSTALAMGANVIGVSRNAEGLEKLKAKFPSVRTVQATGEVEADTAAIKAATKQPVDAFLDLSPPAATGNSIVTACMLSVKSYGRIVLMGGRNDASIPFPWPLLLFRNLTIKGGFMYEREDIRKLIRLAETGHLKLGKENGFEIASSFSLEDWDKCADAAIEQTASGRIVALAP
ncbi:alcohol dehydrogenase [Fusarium albosuccineum]|uniref:Alcohol dehydrogenase n=1 Tax=Fusarium albosuccineum TaxID=1237068 RepID=A0A8H4PC48_9HYPO|nr:alcohol dehydrogenase [Fusarium albosuccineum]